MGCIWFYIVDAAKVWVPNMDFIYFKTDLYDSVNSRKYWNSMYHSVMLFGVNEMAPRNTMELALSSFIMLFSAMVNANIFGQMAVLV